MRPDPQAIWQSEGVPLWKKADATYHRSKTGGGHWEVRSLPEQWTINYEELVFNIKPMSFKHTGVFPEQAANWDFIREQIRSAGRP
ncbi:MAG: SAM-dependent methyltransferase, partial [Clostridia bacterium]|nr:SAM-dependent methyltransferase [Clostridia bacterium]